MRSILFALALIPALVAARGIDVEVSLNGQTYGFIGDERSFVQTPLGGHVSMDVATLASPGDFPMPQVDVSQLPAAHNQWSVDLVVGHVHQTFAGTCAVTTYDNGSRLVLLTCRDLAWR